MREPTMAESRSEQLGVSKELMCQWKFGDEVLVYRRTFQISSLFFFTRFSLHNAKRLCFRCFPLFFSFPHDSRFTTYRDYGTIDA